MFIKPQVIVADGEDYLIKSESEPIVSGGCELDGYCGFKKHRIRVKEDQWGLEAVETVVHEYIHAQQPYLKEDVVTRLALEQVEMMGQLGLLRLPKKPGRFKWPQFSR